MKNTLLCVLLAIGVAAHASPAANDKSVYIVVLEKGDDKPFDAGAGATQLARQGRRIAMRIPEPAVEGLRHNPRVRYIQRAVLGSAPHTTTAAFAMKVQSSAVRTPQTDTGSSWTTGTYTYDGDGNIWSIGDDRFTYDGAERLVTSTVYSGGTAHTESFTYDPYGNLTGKTTDGTSTSYAVNAATNRYIAPMSVTYDNMGNVAIDSLGAQYGYDAAGMVKSKGNEVYIYSADDERVAVSAGILASDGWRWTVREANQTVAREYESFGGPEGSDYFVFIEDHAYAGTKLVSSERESIEGGRRHFHVDHLGTPRFMTNDAAQILSEHTYRPYGVEITSAEQERNRGYERDEPMRFTGHERDGINNSLNPSVGYVDYMHARYYNPFWGRFLSVDPKRGSAPQVPQSWNRYSYARGNPVKYIDPDGRDVYIAVTNIVVGATTVNSLPHRAGNVENVPAYKIVVMNQAGSVALFSGSRDTNYTGVVRDTRGSYGSDHEAPPGTYFGHIRTDGTRGARVELSDAKGGDSIKSPDGTNRENVQIHIGPGCSQGCVLLTGGGDNRDAFMKAVQDQQQAERDAGRDDQIHVMVLDRNGSPGGDVADEDAFKKKDQ